MIAHLHQPHVITYHIFTSPAVSKIRTSRTDHDDLLSDVHAEGPCMPRCLVRTVVATPLMCSSRRSKQTGHVGSSVCPEGAERAGLFAKLSEMNSTSLTYKRRQTISGSSEENCIQEAHRTGDPQSGSPACRVITEQRQKTWRIMPCRDTW